MLILRISGCDCQQFMTFFIGKWHALINLCYSYFPILVRCMYTYDRHCKWQASVTHRLPVKWPNSHLPRHRNTIRVGKIKWALRQLEKVKENSWIALYLRYSLVYIVTLYLVNKVIILELYWINKICDNIDWLLSSDNV